MTIGLGDTTCVQWSTPDAMASFGVTGCDTLTDPSEVGACQQSQAATANTVTYYAHMIGENQCIPPGILSLFPNKDAYIASHSAAPPPPLPAVVQAPPAPAPTPGPAMTPVSTPVAAPIMVGNSGSPITPAPASPAPTSSSAPMPSPSPSPSPAASSGLPATIFGINSTYVLIGGAALLFLMMSGGKR
jgi:hypothetical protein